MILKAAGEVGAWAAVGTAIMQITPPVVAILGLIWWIIQFYLKWPEIKARYKDSKKKK